MSSRGKSILILLLGGSVLGIGMYAWISGTGTTQLMLEIIFALTLVVLYVLNGLALPRFAYRYFHINRDDDPENLPTTLYLLILLAAIVIAGLVVFFGLKR